MRDRLAEGRSPRQISGWLKSGAERGLCAAAMETIYAVVYRARRKAEELWRYLARRHKRRRPPRTRPSRDTIEDRTSIHERPDSAADRSEMGHWEGASFICRRARPVPVLHERRSPPTLAARLAGKGAAETAATMMAVFRRLDPALRRSITFGNGTCFARHGWLRKALDMTTWSCDACASWQKGGIENADGRLRRWLPRQTDLDGISDADIQETVVTDNLTPRKCLGDTTPIPALLRDLGRDVGRRFA